MLIGIYWFLDRRWFESFFDGHLLEGIFYLSRILVAFTIGGFILN